MSHFDTKPVDPLKAPWPPEIAFREVRHPTLGDCIQFRPDSVGGICRWLYLYCTATGQPLRVLSN